MARLCFSLASFVLVSSCFCSKNLDSSDFDYVAVLPDIHGDATAFLHSVYLIYKKTTPNARFQDVSDFIDELLLQIKGPTRRKSNPMDSRNRVLVVQLGDIIHRGKDSAFIYSFMDELDQIFKWTIVSLVGNHEIMAHLGKDSAYLHPEEHVQYGGHASRLKSFQENGVVWSFIKAKYGMMARLGGRKDTSSSRSPRTLFVHGGVEISWFTDTASVPIDKCPNTGLPLISVDNVNAYFHSILDNKAEVERVLMDSKSPLWSRSFLNLADSALCAKLLPTVLKLFDVSRIIVGHSANSQDGRVRTRCGGKIVLADFAMSRGVNAKKRPNPGALIMRLYTTGDGERQLKYISELHSNNREHFWLKRPVMPITTTCNPTSTVEDKKQSEKRSVEKSSSGSRKKTSKKKWYKKFFSMFRSCKK